jgi:RimJ/RimL family protein N-acetyltransferase
MTELEPLAEQHLDAIVELVRDPDVLRCTRVPVRRPPGSPRSGSHATRRVAATARARGSRSSTATASRGWRWLRQSIATPGRPSSATSWRRGRRGRGLATWALGALTRWGFDECDLIRLELLISVENEASKKVAERCGYVREGILRSLHIKPGVREDTEIWSRLASD